MQLGHLKGYPVSGGRGVKGMYIDLVGFKSAS